MKERPTKSPRSRASFLSILLGSFVLLPFALLGIALVDDHFLHTRLPHKVYNALGIWEPLESLHNGVVRLFGG